MHKKIKNIYPLPKFTTKNTALKLATTPTLIDHIAQEITPNSYINIASWCY